MISQPHKIGISNLCIYYGKCGGCTLQHLGDIEYKEYKMHGFDEAEFIELNNPFRRKLNLTFVKKNGRLILGLHAANSDDIINIRSCPASEPGISNLIPHLADFLEKNLIDRESGNLFLLQLRTGVVIKLLIKTDRGTLEIMNLSRKIKALRKFTEIISVKFYANNNLIITHESEVPYIEFYPNIMVETEADSFLQAAQESDKIISEFVINSIKSEERNLSKLNLLDLFCGRGTISVPLCAMGAKIDAVDFDNSALESLRMGLRDYTINIKKRDLIYKPLLYTELMNYDYIILNPPRKGASEQIREIVKAAQMGANFKKIIYISCSKKSFKEDVNILTKNEGFRVTGLKILDQFKWTEHVEILSEISV